jgi:hypothetical protein
MTDKDRDVLAGIAQLRRHAEEALDLGDVKAAIDFYAKAEAELFALAWSRELLEPDEHGVLEVEVEIKRVVDDLVADPGVEARPTREDLRHVLLEPVDEDDPPGPVAAWCTAH